MSGTDAAFVYIELGYNHILPLGLDHILFVLSLFLLSPKLKPVLWQATAFTVAHSITLGLGHVSYHQSAGKYCRTAYCIIHPVCRIGEY